MRVRIQFFGGGDAKESPSDRFDRETLKIGNIVIVDGLLVQVESHYSGTRNYDLCVFVKVLQVDQALALLVSTVQTLRREVKDLRGEINQLKTAPAEEAVA